MGAFRIFEDYDHNFHTSRVPTLLINNLDSDSKEKRDEINNLMYFLSEDGEFNSIPSCICGSKQGRYNVGLLCNSCGSQVTEPIGDDLPSYLWLKRPRDVEPLINPFMLMQLRKVYEKDSGKFDIFAWMMDPLYKTKSTSLGVMQIISILERDPIISNRGYNNFVRNWNYIYEFLVNNNQLLKPTTLKKGSKPSEGDYGRGIPLLSPSFVLEEVAMAQHQGVLFSEYVPLLNKSLIVVEKSSMASYIDPYVAEMISGTRLLIGIDCPGTLNYNLQARARENRVAKFLLTYADFHKNYASGTAGGKQGFLRRLLMGTRLDYTFRAVITSITRPHKYNTIEVPWTVAIVAFEQHLTNKLLKRGWSPPQIKQYLNRYTHEFSPLINELFDELTAETPGGHGFECLMNRNPTMHRGSLQKCLAIIKRDPRDKTLGISELLVVPFNADFDGDQHNVTLFLDEYTANGFRYMVPEANIYNANSLEPGNMTHLPEPVGMNIANWLSAEDLAFVPEKYERMRQLAI